MITFSRAIGIFFAGIFSGYGATAQRSACRFPKSQSSTFRVRQGRPFDESSGGVALNYFLPLHFFEAASH
jgi:hypothetical protein